MPEKMLAEWFWIDRWMGSSAFLLPIEARGLYREMLSQAWRRGARLPNDHEAIKRAVGCSDAEWARCWPLVSTYWTVDGEHLVNDTQRSVYGDALKRRAAAQRRGLMGAGKRWGNGSTNSSTTGSTNAQAHAQAIASDLRSPITTNYKDSRPTPSASDRRFAEFWAAYPKKTGKDAARKAFERRRVDDALLATMIAAIRQQAQSRQWTEEGGRFIPNPSTWLNQGRWQDESQAPVRRAAVGAVRHWTPDDCQHDTKHFSRAECEHADRLAEFRASRAAEAVG